jgi:hypothetical protein
LTGSNGEEDEMGDYNIPEDYDGPVRHVIYCRADWKTCFGVHETVAEVQDCYRKARVARNDPDYFPCGWLVEIRTEDGIAAIACGALARVTSRGFECEAGHEHVHAEIRHREGWEYAEDLDEAHQLFRAGVEPRTMAGQVWPA